MHIFLMAQPVWEIVFMHTEWKNQRKKYSHLVVKTNYRSSKVLRVLSSMYIDWGFEILNIRRIQKIYKSNLFLDFPSYFVVQLQQKTIITFAFCFLHTTFLMQVSNTLKQFVGKLGRGCKVQSFELAVQDSHPCLYCNKTWYYLYISDPFW